MNLWLGHVIQRVQPTPGCLSSSTDAAAEILKETKRLRQSKTGFIHLMMIPKEL